MKKKTLQDVRDQEQLTLEVVLPIVASRLHRLAYRLAAGEFRDRHMNLVKRIRATWAENDHNDRCNDLDELANAIAEYKDGAR